MERLQDEIHALKEFKTMRQPKKRVQEQGGRAQRLLLEKPAAPKKKGIAALLKYLIEMRIYDEVENKEEYRKP